MKATDCNRALLVWALIQLALAFGIVIPFSLTPVVWGGLLVLGGAAFLCAAMFDRKLPRILARVLWVLLGILRWALLVYLVYAAFFFVPDATLGYDAESRADIFAAALVPLLALCVVTLPSQAFVARRSKADTRRAFLLSLFSAVVAVLLYAYESFAIGTVPFLTDGLLGKLLGVAAAVVSVAVLAVAFRGVLAQKEQQKTAPDTSSKAAK